MVRTAARARARAAASGAADPPNLPRARSLWYKPSANQTDITPRYWLRETDAWIVFPHELEGLTIDEIGAKWDPQIAEIVKAPGGPFAPK